MSRRFPVTRTRVRSADGTLIASYRAGRGPRRLVMAPGLGTPFLTWHYLIEDLGERVTLLTWDPRGTYGSEVPADRSRLGVEDHVSDMVAVCRHAGFDRFVLGGWSMGVEVALEYAHRFPAQVEALVLIAGTYEHILDTALGLPGGGLVARGLLRLARLFVPWVGPAVFLALGSNATLRLLGRTGMLMNNTEFFAGMVREFRHLDFRTYLRMVECLDKHTAAPYLETIRVPALIVAGSEDRVTPWTKMDALHKAIRGSEFFLVPNGTHYVLVEYPEVVNLRVRAFLDDVEKREGRRP